MPVGDGNRGLDRSLIGFGFEDDFEFVTASVEHNDFSGLIDAVELAVGAGKRGSPRSPSADFALPDLSAGFRVKASDRFSAPHAVQYVKPILVIKRGSAIRRRAVKFPDDACLRWIVGAAGLDSINFAVLMSGAEYQSVSGNQGRDDSRISDFSCPVF